MRRHLIFFACLILLLTPHAGHAYWDDAGNPLSFSLDDENLAAMVPDGTGGTIVAWVDRIQVPSEDRARVQRVDRRGDARWPSNGINLGGSRVGSVSATSDGAGGVIVAWSNRTIGDYDLYIQRIDHDGQELWIASGVVVANTPFDATGVAVCGDGSGGAFVTWSDARSGTNDLYIQRIDSDGNANFSTNGIAVSATSSFKTGVSIVNPSTNTAILLWRDFRSGNTDLYAQAINTLGNRLWVVDTAVCSEASEQSSPRMIRTDSSGGVIVAWTDLRNGKSDLFAQALRSDGSPAWLTDGLGISVSPHAISWNGGLVSDDADGAIVTWGDTRNGNFDVFAQRVDFRGNVLWGVNGLPVCTTPEFNTSPVMVPDGVGGALIAWMDFRSNQFSEVYAQRVSSAGLPQWGRDGEPVLTGAVQMVSGLMVVEDPGRGMLLSWMDRRGDDGEDIYAYYFAQDGRSLPPAPRILAVDDVEGDEGGWVRMLVRASPYDELEAFYDIVTGYNVWRMLPPLAAMKEATQAPPRGVEEVDNRRLLALLNDPVASVGFRPSAPQAAALGLPPGDWESLGLHGAMMLDSYSFTVPTKTDSTETSPAVETYLVTAHTITPSVVFVSETADGYSVDNLAPGMPMALAGSPSYQPLGLHLNWSTVPASDLSHYAIYRGTESGFVPDASHLIGEPAANAWFDTSWEWPQGFWYKVAAVDRHGNESLFGVLDPDIVVDAPEPGRRNAQLNGCYPNPFNPSTTISYSIPRETHVELVIYDLAGRRVRTLVRGQINVGAHEQTWNGTDDAGTQVASGVYLYQLRAGEYVETKRMVLVK